jgi:hypothetical protein
LYGLGRFAQKQTFLLIDKVVHTLILLVKRGRLTFDPFYWREEIYLADGWIKEHSAEEAINFHASQLFEP